MGTVTRWEVINNHHNDDDLHFDFKCKIYSYLLFALSFKCHIVLYFQGSLNLCSLNLSILLTFATKLELLTLLVVRKAPRNFLNFLFFVLANILHTRVFDICWFYLLTTTLELRKAIFKMLFWFIICRALIEQ